MTPAVPASRLAQSLGPLGLIGSILLHGAVLATLLERPAPSAGAPQPEPPVIFHVAIAVAPAPGPDSGAPPEPEPFSPRPENLLPERPVPESPVSAPLVPEASPTPPVARAPAPPPIPPPQRPRPVAKPAPKRLDPKSATPAGTPPIPLPPAVPQAAPAPEPGPEPGPGPGPGPGQGPILNLPTAPVQITRIRARDQRPPVYPEGARRDELEGTVRLKLTVSPSGQVEEAAVLKSSGHRLLDQAAQSAARLWQLYPAEQDGKPVAGWAEVEIPFRLTD